MNTLKMALQALPMAIAVVKAVEEAIPVAGQGKRKLDLVLDVVRSAYDASAELRTQFSFEQLVALVVPMIARIVDLHNELGLFPHRSAEAPR